MMLTADQIRMTLLLHRYNTDLAVFRRRLMRGWLLLMERLTVAERSNRTDALSAGFANTTDQLHPYTKASLLSISPTPPCMLYQPCIFLAANVSCRT